MPSQPLTYVPPRWAFNMGSMSSSTLDLRLYAILDPEQFADCAELARQVVRGGATLVQLRDKHSATRAMIGRAQAIKAALSEGAPARVPFLVNDRVDVALAVGADGVHLGQDDMDIENARRLLGPHAIIGLSLKTIGEAATAPLNAIDYAGIGGVFATSSKNNPGAPIGPAGLARIIEALRARKPDFPVCAIAGITASNAAEAIGAGADGIAVISALAKARDTEAAARGLRGIVDAGLRDRSHR
jgi:thiamine-phosphate pyrophosphorylase